MKKIKEVKAEKNLEKEKSLIKVTDFSLEPIEKVDRTFTDWIEREKIVEIGYPVLVTCDWHVPHTSVEWVRILRDVQQKRKVPNLIIAGDFLDEEGSSSFVGTGPKYTLGQELRLGSIILNGLLEYFQRIYIILGNHDFRLLRDLGKKAEGFFSQRFARILFGEMLAPALIDTRVFVSNLQFCETVDKKWRICHPKNYSKRGTTVPKELAEIERQNIIGGHGHQLAMEYTKDKDRYLGIAGGGMFNEDSILYKQEPNTSPKWNNGFVLLNEKGEARLYGEGLEMI